MPEPELIQRQHDLLRHFRQAGHTREDQETEIRKQYEDLVVEVDTTLDKVRLSVETERARILPAAETQRKSEHDKIENAIDIVQSNVSGHLEKIEMTVEMVHSDFMSIEDLQELWPDEGADISVGIIDNAEQQLVQCEQFLAEVADQIRSAVDEYHEDRILSARRQQQKRMIVLLSLVPVVFAVAMQIAGVKGVWRFNSDAIVFSVSMAILVPLLVAIIWWIISMIRDVDEYHEDRILGARRQQQKRMIVLLSLVPVVFAVAMQIAGVRVLWRYNSDAIVVSFSVAILVPLLVATIWWLNSLIRQDNSSSGNRPQASTKPVTTPANIEMSMAETQNIRPMNDSPSSMFVEVPAGTFLMGSSSDEGENNEQPQHSVFLDDFWISLTAVTNAQWRAFMQAGGYDRQELWTDEAWDWCTENDIVEPGCWDDTNLNADNQPVVGVSWHEASAYCRWLSEVSGGEVRLPTEAEWEKTARGTDGQQYPWGNMTPNDRHANFDGNEGCIAPVGNFPNGASPYEVLDMAGNIWEWTADWYDENYYSRPPQHNPTGPDTGEDRVLRGGSWQDSALLIRCAFRGRADPGERFDDTGFRLVAQSHDSNSAISHFGENL